MKKLVIKQVHSSIGRKYNQKLVLESLGIHKMGREVMHDDTPQIRGMINKISHLLEVTEVDK